MIRQQGSVLGSEIAQGTLEVGDGQSLRHQERPQIPRMLLHPRSLTVAYVRLPEAQFVNVGTVMILPLHQWWWLTSLQVTGHHRTEAP
jgi:hypothetical protein